jgi:hypothetical protein
MKTPKTLVTIGFCGTLFFGIWIGWTRVLDTTSNRRRVSAEVRSLVDAAKKNIHDRTIVEKLLKRAQSSYKFEATKATVGLGEIGDAAIPVIGEIAELMESNDPYVRREAARALSKLGVRSTPVLEQLIRQVMKNPIDDESWFAADAIGKIGKPAVRCIPMLKSRLGTGGSIFDDSLNQAISLLEQLNIDGDMLNAEGEKGDAGQLESDTVEKYPPPK